MENPKEENELGIMNEKQELVFQLINNEYVQPYFKDDIELSKLSKVSLSDITMLGAAFAPLAQVMSLSSTATAELIKQFGTDTLYRATDTAGKAINLSTVVNGEEKLNRFIGSYVKDGKTGQSRFSPVSMDKLAENKIVFDPATALMAAELMYIAHEIKVVKQQQEDMFSYLLLEKRAELEGSLSFLIKVMNDYKDNYKNEVYKTSMHIKVLDIKQQAEQAITASRKHIESFFKKKKDDYNRLASHYQSYQIALYLYAFSSFTEIVVLENFNPEYLNKVYNRIEELSNEYRTMYTDGYNYISGKYESTPQAVILGIGSKVGKKIGEGIAKTKVGDKTQIDEKIIGSSEKLNDIKESNISKQLNEFCNYKDTRVQSFTELIFALGEIFNNKAIMFDSENLYIPKLN